jgi:hypothetical protein
MTMTVVLILALAALVWTLIPKPLGKGYRVLGRFKGRTLTYNDVAIAELQLRGGHWHVEHPAYPFPEKRVFLTRNGAVSGAIRAHRRAQDQRVAQDPVISR